MRVEQDKIEDLLDGLLGLVLDRGLDSRVVHDFEGAFKKLVEEVEMVLVQLIFRLLLVELIDLLDPVDILLEKEHLQKYLTSIFEQQTSLVKERLLVFYLDLLLFVFDFLQL